MSLRLTHLDGFALHRGFAAACGLLAILAAATIAKAGPCDTAIPNPAPAPADWFGYSVAVSGDVVVVGASQDDNPTTLDTGSIYIYRSNGAAWLLEQTIPNTASTPSGDKFGSSVGVSGDVVVVGAPFAGGGATGSSGEAYVYRYDGSAWLLDQTIPNPELTADDRFGNSVAVSGDAVVIGAQFDNPGGVGNAGSAYVYRYNGSAWLLEQAIPNPDPAANDLFGYSVAVSGDVVVVGVRQDDPGGVSGAGSAYVFRYNGSAWLLDLAIPNPQPATDDLFGAAVAISGDVVVVGAGADNPGNEPNAGSAYVYRYNGSVWGLDQTIHNPQLGPEFQGASDTFGDRVSVSSDVVVIGALFDDPGGVSSAGSAYVYRYNGSAWVQDQWIPNPEPFESDYFGWSVAVSGDVTVVGAYQDRPGGVGGAGSAYVFGCASVACCTGDFDASNVVTDADIPDFVAALLAGGACPAPPACCPGDFNADGLVDGADVSGFLATLFSGGACP